MALNECSNCHQPTPKWAGSCPHCGAKQQPIKAKQIAIGIFIAAGAATLYTQGSSESPPPGNAGSVEQALSSSTKEASVISDQECIKDINCWFERTMPEAAYPCQEAIEKVASYEVKWDDSFLSLAFTKAAWSIQEEGVIILMGDKVKFQNGHGAFQNMRYACTWSPANDAVIDIAVEPGRF